MTIWQDPPKKDSNCTHQLHTRAKETRQKRKHHRRHMQRSEPSQSSKHLHVSLSQQEDDLDNREVVGNNAEPFNHTCGRSEAVTSGRVHAAARSARCWEKRRRSRSAFAAVPTPALPHNCTTQQNSAHQQNWHEPKMMPYKLQQQRCNATVTMVPYLSACTIVSTDMKRSKLMWEKTGRTRLQSFPPQF